MSWTGIVVHDTVGKDGTHRRKGTPVRTALNIAKNGVTQAGGRHIPGPLYNFQVSRAGSIFTIAKGTARKGLHLDMLCKANHAGRCDGALVHALERGDLDLRCVPRDKTDNPNSRLLGVALMRQGWGWRSSKSEIKRYRRQEQAAARLIAALCARWGLTELNVCGHSNIRVGKRDPAPAPDVILSLRAAVAEELEQFAMMSMMTEHRRRAAGRADAAHRQED